MVCDEAEEDVSLAVVGSDVRVWADVCLPAHRQTERTATPTMGDRSGSMEVVR
jgi:hypothetical protein